MSNYNESKAFDSMRVLSSYSTFINFVSIFHKNEALLHYTSTWTETSELHF